jgi:hypothetical protein
MAKGKQMAEVQWQVFKLPEPYTIEVGDRFKLVFRNHWDTRQETLLDSEEVTTKVEATHYAILKTAVGVGMFVGTSALETFLRGKWADGECDKLDKIL